MINTFLRNLEKLLGLCISIIFLCRIINTHATNIFLDFFVIVAVVVFLIWGIWAMFFGGREILILPPKLEKQIKKINLSTVKRKVYYAIGLILTIIYIIFIVSVHKRIYLFNAYIERLCYIYCCYNRICFLHSSDSNFSSFNFT